MKKIGALLMTVCMLASVSAFATACGGGGESSHNHTFENTWTKDQTHHWYACTDDTCTEIKDKAEHTWNDGTTTNGVTTYSCTVCGQTRTETVTGEPVTIEQWETALALTDTNYSMSGTATHSSEGQATMEFDRDGYNFKRVIAMPTQSQTSYGETTEDGMHYLYSDGMKLSIGAQEYGPMLEYPLWIVKMYVFSENYNAFTYNETTQSYTAETISDEDDTYTNVTAKFLGGKLVSLAYTDAFEDGSVIYNFTFTYGNTVVTFPTIEEGGDEGGEGGEQNPDENPNEKSLTQAEWELALGFAFDNYQIDETTKTEFGDSTYLYQKDGAIVYEYYAMGEDGALMKTEDYYIVENEQCTHYYKYSYMDSDKWTREILDLDGYLSESNQYSADVFSYDSFIYDAEKDVYIAQEIINEGEIMRDIQFVFADGKLVSAQFSVEYDGDIYQVSAQFTYGAIEVALPNFGDVEEGGNQGSEGGEGEIESGEEVTKEIWQSALSADSLENFTMTGTYVKDAAMEETIVSVINVDGLSSHESSIDMAENLSYDYYYIYDETTQTYTRYFKNANMEEWEIDDCNFSYNAYTLLTLLPLTDQYDAFTYDEDLGAYMAMGQTYETDMGTFKYSVIMVRIKDGKLLGVMAVYAEPIQITPITGNMVYALGFEFSNYGNVQVSAPVDMGQEEKTFSIEYKAVMGGVVSDIPQGLFTNDGLYPDSYVEGEGANITDLKETYQTFNVDGSGKDYTFKGWYIDEACTQAFSGITQETTGDITLYAKITYAFWSPSV